MDWSRELKYILGAALAFIALYFLPGQGRFLDAMDQGILLLHDYAREHVIFCLVPAFFIAGAIEVFLSDTAVMKYLGAQAPRALAYGVASIAGSILAVCSCTILPLFAGIYKMGAGLGPATTFLYSGPAINVLAIILSARVLGLKIGAARAVGAITAGILIGLAMAAIFRGEDKARASTLAAQPPSNGRPLHETGIFLATLVFILISGTWGRGQGVWQLVFKAKWLLTSLGATFLAVELWRFYKVHSLYLAALAVVIAIVATVAPGPELPYCVGVAGLSYILYKSGGQARAWLESSYILARKIIPILFLGVFVAGVLLGRPGGEEGLIGSRYVSGLVGGDSLASNLFASIVGAFMYFATLTEIPILQGLMHAGMGMGPALALLLAGPAVSLPNMLVIRSVMGTAKTVAYVLLVIVFATVSGVLFGILID